MKFLLAILVAIVFASNSLAQNLPPVQTVFIIVLENHDWSSMVSNASAPFINGTLLPMASHCEQYYCPNVHPSELNYVWLEAGTNLGILDNNDPSINHQNTTNHLTDQLLRAGISWKSYQEDIAGDVVPLSAVNSYVPRHDPFVFFDDITGTNDPNYAYGIAHIRPLTELDGDLTNNSVVRYNFITPNLCDDGHDTCAPEQDSIKQIDDWLGAEIPKILNSAAYSNNGAIFITWDEGENRGNGPIGLILLSPLARGGGYANNIFYTHSSLLRTVQEIFGVSPFLADAANVTDLSDLFRQFDIQFVSATNDLLQFKITTVFSGRTHFIETSSNLINWSVIGTNDQGSNTFFFSDPVSRNHDRQFYRVCEMP